MFKDLNSEDKRSFVKDFTIEFVFIILKIIGVLVGLASIAFVFVLCVYNPWFLLVIGGIIIFLLIIKGAKNNAIRRFETRKSAKESMERAAESIKSYEKSLKKWKHTIASEAHSEKEIANEVHHCETCLEYWEGKYAEALVTYIAKGGKLGVE